jgi:methylmalonyl-CoA epimerase
VINGIGHIGIFVLDIESAVSRFCHVFDLPIPPIKDLSARNMKVAVIQWGEVGLEFIEDYSGNGSVACMVKERGDFIHHFCLLTDDMEGEITSLEGKGIKMLQPSPGVGLRGKRIAFVASGILEGVPIELSEP